MASARAGQRMTVAVVSAALAGGGALVGWALAPRSSPPASSVAFDTPAPLPLTRGDTSKLVAAPEFRVRTIEGQTVTLADVRGRPAVLFFMAYWCSSCLPEAQALGRIHDEFSGQGLQIIAVDLDPTSSPDALDSFREFAGDPEYMFALDIGGNTARAFKASTLDTTIVIDREGRIAWRDNSVTDYVTLRDAIGPVI